MRVYRISRRPFAGDLSGDGAARFGGRWNPPGVPVLYAANSTALAALETLVHFDPDLMPSLSRITLEVPDSCAPSGDPLFPGTLEASRLAGKSWIKNRETLGLKVVSAVLPKAEDAFNFLLNPAHHDFGQVRILDISDFQMISARSAFWISPTSSSTIGFYLFLPIIQ